MSAEPVPMAFYCEYQHKCKWQGFALYQGFSWGPIKSALSGWRERHDANCGGRLIELAPLPAIAELVRQRDLGVCLHFDELLGHAHIEQLDDPESVAIAGCAAYFDMDPKAVDRIIRSLGHPRPAVASRSDVATELELVRQRDALLTVMEILLIEVEPALAERREALVEYRRELTKEAARQPPGNNIWAFVEEHVELREARDRRLIDAVANANKVYESTVAAIVAAQSKGASE